MSGDGGCISLFNPRSATFGDRHPGFRMASVHFRAEAVTCTLTSSQVSTDPQHLPFKHQKFE